MKRNYEIPQTEVIEIEIEDAVLNPSPSPYVYELPGFGDGGAA